MAYTKYSLTPADNNAAPPNGAPEGMLPSAVNDTMRDMMAQIRDVGDGVRDGTYTMTAPVITGGSITGAALSGNTLTNPVVDGGTITNATITGGSVSGITDLAVADGGTGASTAADARVNLGVDNYGSMKNRIINGAMVIDQRNAGASVTPTDGQYTLDRWVAETAQSSKFSVQQNAGSVTPPTGFINYLGVTSLSAYTPVSTDYMWLSQRIEGFNIADLGWGTANAKTVTVSFWVRSSLTGAFGSSLSNSAASRVYPFNYNISSANTWEYKTVTIAGDTSGTWNTSNGNGIMMQFNLGTGSNRLGTSSAWGSTDFRGGLTGATAVVGTDGATFYITGVQLEVGTQATSFEYRQYGQELALCQRYFQVFYGSASGTPLLARNNAAGANQGPALNIWLKTTMRSAPTGTILGTWGVTNCGQPIFSFTGTEAATLYSNSTTSGDCLFLANDSTAGASMSSEL